VPPHRRTAITEHCCQQLRDEVEHRCEEHPDPYECPEHLIRYVPEFDEYGLIVHDGGTSYVEIGFCPWCGTKLPPSQRDRWWSEMERLGIDPWRETPPPAYRTDAWYRSPEAEPAEAEDPDEASERSWVVATADAGRTAGRNAEEPEEPGTAEGGEVGEALEERRA
jgi:hypothetical protein